MGEGNGRRLFSPGIGVRTVEQVARLANYGNPRTVYEAMKSGGQIAGHDWEWQDAEPGPDAAPHLAADPPAPAPEWRGGDVDALPVPTTARVRQSRNTSPVALGVIPINPLGPGLLTAPWGVPPYYAPR